MQRPSQEADSSSARQEILHILCALNLVTAFTNPVTYPIPEPDFILHNHIQVSNIRAINIIHMEIIALNT